MAAMAGNGKKGTENEIKKPRSRQEIEESIRAQQRELAALDEPEAGNTEASGGDADGLDGRESDFSLSKKSPYVIFSPNHQLMAKPRPNERNPAKRQRYFFYKRLTDDVVLCYTEAEADFMLKSTHKVILRQIGVSDGSAYSKFIRTCGIKPGEQVLRKRAQEVLDGAYKAELEAARGHYVDPDPQNVHFDDTVRRHRNARGIIEGFNPA